jgi:hypothetical protein
MMWTICNNGAVIGWLINDRSVTKDEALDMIGMTKQEKENIDDPDCRFGGRDFWYDDLTVEPVTNEMGLYLYINRVGSDEWVEKYDNARDAIIAANSDWRRMEEADRRTRSEFYVLKSAAETLDAPNAYDGDVIATWI